MKKTTDEPIEKRVELFKNEYIFKLKQAGHNVIRGIGKANINVCVYRIETLTHGKMNYFPEVDKIQMREGKWIDNGLKWIDDNLFNNLTNIRINLVIVSSDLADEEFQDLYHKEHDIETCTEEETEMFNKMYDRYYNFINERKL
jgi:hypothetical protein